MKPDMTRDEIHAEVDRRVAELDTTAARLRDGSPEADAFSAWLDAEYERWEQNKRPRERSWPGVTPMAAFYAGCDWARKEQKS